MDIDHSNFQQQLPTILDHISKAHFIAFDLELSGIPSRKYGKAVPTLEERYLDNKAAAEKFHILQLGLTCVEEDSANGSYHLRPYNFNLSPLVIDELGIDRSFTYSASAVKFLLSNGYDIASPFEKGIPYLTRAETVQARESLMKRFDKQSIPDVFIRPKDTETPKFIARLKREIDEWQVSREPQESSFEFSNPNPAHPDFPIALDRFQRRIVHQIVRSEYPSLSTSSKSDRIVIHTKDEKQEANDKAELVKRIASSLRRQIGIRWIAEAMAGTYEVASEEFETGKESKRDRSPKVVLGHNCFMDFIFLYKLFYGELPATLEEFRQLLNETFPIILDSKFIATQCPDTTLYRRYTLGELENVFSTEDEQPSMQIPIDHSKDLQLHKDKYHEAGFDSLVTAKVCLRLASRAGTPAGRPDAAGPISTAGEKFDATFEDVKSKSKKKSKKSQKGDRPDSSNARFSHSNPFETLSDADMQVAAVEIEEAEKPVSTSRASASRAREPDLGTIINEMARLTTRGSGKLIPRWTDSYWAKNGNRLRVYGTAEEAWTLSPASEDAKAAVLAEPQSSASTDEGVVEEEARGSEKSSRSASILGRLKNAFNPFD